MDAFFHLFAAEIEWFFSRSHECLLCVLIGRSVNFSGNVADSTAVPERPEVANFFGPWAVIAGVLRAFDQPDDEHIVFAIGSSNRFYAAWFPQHFRSILGSRFSRFRWYSF